MSYELKDYKAIEKYNKMMINQTDKEERKAKLLTADLPDIIKEIVEEREVLLKWADNIFIKYGFVDETLSDGAKVYNILSAWKSSKH